MPRNSPRYFSVLAKKFYFTQNLGKVDQKVAENYSCFFVENLVIKLFFTHFMPMASFYTPWNHDLFYCYLAAPRPTLGHYQGGSLSHPMLITCVLHIRPEGHQEPRNEVGSLTLAECLVGFEPGTFRFWSQRLNPLGDSALRKRIERDQQHEIVNCAQRLILSCTVKLVLESIFIITPSQFSRVCFFFIFFFMKEDHCILEKINIWFFLNRIYPKLEQIFLKDMLFMFWSFNRNWPHEIWWLKTLLVLFLF